MVTLFKSSRVALPDGVRPAQVLVENGRIEAVLPYGEAATADRVVDAGDKVLLPGLVDSHVHVNEPGRTLWEGFSTATRAAAKGGVTTLVDMPLNSIPATTTVEALEVKRSAAEGQLTVDVGLWGGVVPGNAKELGRMLDAGALGFKCFLVESGVDEFPCVGEPDLVRAMTELAASGAPLLCHAEIAGPIDAVKAEVQRLDPRKYSSYLRSRPAAAEDRAIAMLAALSRAIGGRVHIVHLASASALQILRAARDEGLLITAETTPHYLHFAAETIPDGATAFKCAPPIRDAKNREGLWAGLEEGLIDLVVSDHSPCSPDLKHLEAGDFAAAWGGISSLQLGLSIVWTDAKKRGKKIEDLVTWLCKGPAELAGLQDKKGAIRKGLDADLVIWDPEAIEKVVPDKIEHRHKVTPYAGEELYGVVEATWVRGEEVYGRGGFSASRVGRILKRSE